MNRTTTHDEGKVLNAHLPPIGWAAYEGVDGEDNSAGVFDLCRECRGFLWEEFKKSLTGKDTQ